MKFQEIQFKNTFGRTTLSPLKQDWAENKEQGLLFVARLKCHYVTETEKIQYIYSCVWLKNRHFNEEIGLAKCRNNYDFLINSSLDGRLFK